MRVMCIADSTGIWRGTSGDFFGPKNYGEICTVTGLDDTEDYFLLEYPTPETFNKKWFIRLSEINETRTVREYKQTEHA